MIFVSLEDLVPGNHLLKKIHRLVFFDFIYDLVANACKDIFYQIVKRLEKSGELTKETVFIDETTLEACANRYTFVWKKSVGKWEIKMF